jgi:hypothetical protein
LAVVMDKNDATEVEFIDKDNGEKLHWGWVYR